MIGLILPLLSVPSQSRIDWRNLTRVVMFTTTIVTLTGTRVVVADLIAKGSGVASQRPRPSAQGQACLVCPRIIDTDGTVLQHKGRDIHLCSPKCVAAWTADPARYFSLIQARGALFDERSVAEESRWFGWLTLGVYVLIGLICGATCSYIAVSKGCPPVKWFFLGLVFNVLAIAGIMATPKGDLSSLPAGVPAGLTKVPVTYQPSICDKCGGENHPSAAACSVCGAALQATVSAETQRV